MKKIFGVFVIALFFIACSSGTKPAETTGNVAAAQVQLNDAQLKSAGVETGAAEKKMISSSIRLHGRIEAPPQNYVSISAPFGGFLRSTELLPGMKVKKGEVLATLEDPAYIELQQNYLTSRAKLSALEKEHKRQSALNESKASSDKQAEQAEADYLSEKANLAALREKLHLCGIDPSALNENSLSRSVPLYSPITGYVAKVNVNVGKHTAPNDVLFELVNPDDIHLALTVFEKDIDKVKVGQKVRAYSNSSPSVYDCEVILLGRNLGSDRSIEIHCHFHNYDHSLLPGMYMNADILTDTIPVPSLPDAAILNVEGGNFVFVEVSKGSFVMERVETGYSSGGFTELLNASAFNDKKIVVKGAYSILMKMKNREEE